MTKFRFLQRKGVYFGFEASGHSGFADAGQDILCAALSAMTQLVVNVLEVSFAADVDYQIDEETADIKVYCKKALAEHESDEKKRYAISGLIQGFFYQLTDMIEDYYEFLDVEVCEA